MMIGGDSQQPLEVAVYLGIDLAGDDGVAAAERAVERGHTLLAIDSAAIEALTRASLPFTTVDDWLDERRRRNVDATSRQCSEEWFASARRDFIVDGVCWPELDVVMMSGFWQEYALQLELGRVFVERDVRGLTFTRSTGAAPSLHRGPADTFGALWQHWLPPRMVLHMRTRPSARPRRVVDLARRGRSKAARAARALTGGAARIPAPRQIRERIVFAIGEDEAPRFAPVVAATAERSLDRVGVVILEPDLPTAALRARAWSLPVLPGPSLRAADVNDCFVRAVSRAKAGAAGQPWEAAFEAAPFHFDHYARHRWPGLVSGLRGWQELWDRAAPSAVVISSLDDLRSQLPAEAARRMGIPSVAIPHAPLYVKTSPSLASQFLLYGFRLQREAFRVAGVSAEQLRPCRAVVPGLPAARRGPASKRQRDRDLLRVLALTNPVNEDHPGRAILDPALGHRDQIVALTALATPPADFDHRLELWIKGHPLYPDSGLVAAADPALLEKMLPPASDLAVVLEEVDVVVGVNYIGSALRWVAAAGKPMIHLWTSPLLRNDSPNPYARSVAAAGAVAASGEEMWRHLRQLRDDNRFSERLRQQAVQFARVMFAEEGPASLYDCLMEMGATPPQRT